MDYEIKYSSRRTLSLAVKDGRLIVRAPIGTPKSRIEEAVSSHLSWIEKHIQRQLEKERLESSFSDDEIKNLKAAARRVLYQKTESYSKIMGLKYQKIRITSAKTRFGSCSSKGNISYSYRLMMYPEAAIDYVVVHELAHLLEMNHSKAFYKIIEKYLPDYKERRKLLKSPRPSAL